MDLEVFGAINPESFLDDILTIANKLESRMPFIHTLSAPTILHLSLEIERDSNNADMETKGQLLLSTEKVDFPPTLNLPLDVRLITLDENSTKSISDRCNEYYQYSIVEVIKKRHKLTESIGDEFIKKALGQSNQHEND